MSASNGPASQGGAKVNGASESSKSKPKKVQSSSHADWVDYKVRYPQARKGKRISRKSVPSNEEPNSQPNPYSEGQTQIYEIVPQSWNELGRYKKFRLMEETSDPMRIGDVVLVNNDYGTGADGEVDIFKQWKAHVLEIRAKDPQHVYLRVFWIYDPEELPGGRRPYHGEYELVPSNDMAIVDAMTVNGLVTLTKWNEYNDDEDPDTGTDENPGFYWRQTYNIHTRQLSQLRQHCFCNKPSNPDNLLVQCTNKATCGRWLHSECLKEKAVEKAIDQIPSGPTTEPTPSKKQRLVDESPRNSGATPSKSKMRKSRGSKEDAFFTAEVVATSGKKGHRLKIHDFREGHNGEEWEERIYCLCCSALLVDEGEEQPLLDSKVDPDIVPHGERSGTDEITVKGQGANGTVASTPPVPAMANQDENIVEAEKINGDSASKFTQAVVG
ncbi:MAG: hypothetical protein Q9165_003798 [Trypethelium subeluteriae]